MQALRNVISHVVLFVLTVTWHRARTSVCRSPATRFIVDTLERLIHAVLGPDNVLTHLPSSPADVCVIREPSVSIAIKQVQFLTVVAVRPLPFIFS